MPEQNTNRALTEAAADEWKVLPSGLTVLVRPMPGYSGTHVIYATRFGSIDRDFRLDDKEVHLPAGVAHFLEHKMFEDQDGDAFAKFAKTGANANAFTAFDRTCYLFTATEQLDESLDVLLEMVGKPYFTQQTIDKEQGIIGQEIKMYDDSADWRLITGLCECLYHSHPIRSDIAGTCESIATITPEMLYDCCKAFYAPNNMVLAAAGNTTMEQILAACERNGLMEPRPAERVQRLWRDEPMTLAAKEKTLRMPNQYSVIPEAELQDLNGGIGADPVDDGKYNLFNNISDLTAPLERAFIRLFDVDYDTQQQLNLGFAALGVFETVLNALNPSALIQAINFSPVLTGVLNGLGKLGLSRL